MKKILLGGSPCTHWSVCKTGKNREIKPIGLGWDLFNNYLVAINKFKPDYFLYENNDKISKDIQQSIEKELNVSLLHFNSNLVSSQNRKRIYGTNIPNIVPPKNKNIYVKDIIDYTYSNENLINKVIFNQFENTEDYIDKPLKIGVIGKGCQGHRVYHINGKTVTLNANGGGRGANTGLYKINNTVRKLSCLEAERCQTLPDNYTNIKNISDSQRYKCIGNGWTAEMIMHILSFMNIDKNEEIVVLSLYDGIATGYYCLKQLGYKNITYYSYEIDPYAIKIAQTNFPNIIQCGDAFQLLDDNWSL